MVHRNRLTSSIYFDSICMLVLILSVIYIFIFNRFWFFATKQVYFARLQKTRRDTYTLYVAHKWNCYLKKLNIIYRQNSYCYTEHENSVNVQRWNFFNTVQISLWLYFVCTNYVRNEYNWLFSPIKWYILSI